MENEEKNFCVCNLPFFILYVPIFVLHFIFWPSNSIPDAILNELDSYYNSYIIMDISTNCNNKSNNILGYFGGVPEGRTYTQKPQKYCSYNPLNYFVGKCKENPWSNYDVCDSYESGDDKKYIYFDKNKCVTINEIKSKYYNYFNGIPLCSNNDNKLNYYTLLKNSTNTIDDCLKQKNMKVCGILDDLNQIVCLHQNYSCPINDNLYIHYTNKNINKKIISSFNISFDKPCSHFYQNPKRSNIFIAHDFIHCNECNNTLFEYIYYENATKFMKDNNLYSSFQQFTSSKFNDYDVNLFSSFYFGLNKTCILEDNFNENSFKNYSSQFSIFKGFHIIFTVFYFILSFIMVIYANMFQGCKLIFALIHAIIFFFLLFLWLLV